MLPQHIGELKSKPAQNSIYEIYKLGLQPNFVITRSATGIDNKKRELIAFNSGIDTENIIAAPDVDTIYKMPGLFKEQELDKKLLREMGLKQKREPLKKWLQKVDTIEDCKGQINIAIIGKYFKIGDKSILEDAYICVIEAIKHAAWYLNMNACIQWFDVERLENKDQQKLQKAINELSQFDGLIVPQGWGSRGVEGKIKAVNYARVNKIPYLGLCFGMQMAVIEYARNILGLQNANSTEVNKRTKYPVIHVMPDQKELLKKKQYGGTIRLGAWPCKLKKDSMLERLYKKYAPNRIHNNIVQERHRHRYEVNNKYKNQLVKSGLIISGTSPDGKLVEAVELPQNVHPYFIATQYHPEYKSWLLEPHPLFIGLLLACINQAKVK